MCLFVNIGSSDYNSRVLNCITRNIPSRIFRFYGKLLSIFSLCVFLCSCLNFDDEREKNEIYDLYNKIPSDYERKLSDIFPGDWEIFCVIHPGATPSTWVGAMLEDRIKDKLPIVDPEEFGDYLWKVVLISRSREEIRIVLLHKRDFTFKGTYCANLENKTIYFHETKENISGKLRSNYIVNIK